jgi:hypothetical protein
MTRTTWQRQLRSLASAYGWSLEHTRGGHLKLTHPAAAVPIFTASTPSDRRALRNVRAELRRRGAGVAGGVVQARVPTSGHG